jgi:hypothetical protein
VRSVADLGLLIDGQGIRIQNPELRREERLKLSKSGYASPVAFDCNDLCSGIEQGVCEAARTGANFVDPLTFQRTRYGRDTRQQPAIEDEVLP